SESMIDKSRMIHFHSWFASQNINVPRFGATVGTMINRVDNTDRKSALHPEYVVSGGVSHFHNYFLSSPAVNIKLGPSRQILTKIIHINSRHGLPHIYRINRF